MTSDILPTTDDPDELRRLAQDLLAAQSRHINTLHHRIHTLEAEYRGLTLSGTKTHVKEVVNILCMRPEDVE